MDHNEFVALRAKVKVANNYLEQAAKFRGKIDLYDILKVVTPKMRENVTIVSPEEAAIDGLGIVRIKEAV